MSEVLIIGGGVIGCASALALARRRRRRRGAGARACPARRPRSAAAGILGAQARGARRRAAGAPLPRRAARCYAGAGRGAAGAHRHGRRLPALRRGAGRASTRQSSTPRRAALRWQRDAGLPLERLDAAAAHAARAGAGARRWPARCASPTTRASTRPLLLRALRVAAERAGARFRTGVAGAAASPSRASARAGWRSTTGTRSHADTWCSPRGAGPAWWPARRCAADTVQPARGQMVELPAPAPLLAGVVYGPAATSRRATTAGCWSARRWSSSASRPA